MTEHDLAVSAGMPNCCPSLDLAQRYCAEVPLQLLDEQGQLLDSLIAIAFDLLKARILDLRVVAAPAPALIGEA